MNEENNVYSKIEINDDKSENIGSEYESKFKVAENKSNLPAKQSSFLTKFKNVLFYEIKVELTPYEQKIEDEINEFLHQEITWQGFKDFLFQEVEITFKGKRIL